MGLYIDGHMLTYWVEYDGYFEGEKLPAMCDLLHLYQ